MFKSAKIKKSCEIEFQNGQKDNILMINNGKDKVKLCFCTMRGITEKKKYKMKIIMVRERVKKRERDSRGRYHKRQRDIIKIRNIRKKK